MSEMDEKRIVIRVDPKTWRLYDDKRHSERRSFQQLGMDLLRRWYEGGLTGPASAGVEKPHTNFPKTLTCPRCESTLSVDQSGLTKVMDPGSVPISEQRTNSHDSAVPSESREWLELVARRHRRCAPVKRSRRDSPYRPRSCRCRMRCSLSMRSTVARTL